MHRAVRASELTGCTDATELQKIIAKKDNSRHTYYNHYTGKKWGDSHNYHLVLDSGKLGYSLCAKLSSKRPRANKSIEKQGTVMFPAFFKYKLTG